MKYFNRSAVTLYATQEMLTWVKQVCPELHRWNLDTINHVPTVYLIEKEDQNCQGDALIRHHESIIKHVLRDRLYISEDLWPQSLTFELFERWFGFEYHEEICDLGELKLEVFGE